MKIKRFTSDDDIQVVKPLLSLATSENKAERALFQYLKSKDQCLFLYEKEGILAGCIGIELSMNQKAVIQHIAVSQDYRKQWIGKRMVEFIREQYNIRELRAETDDDAVGFYEKLGFEMESLSEKYKGVTRYQCTLFRN
ncbi:GNAT family N-acetyltransferase [Halobacillus mangrovi]|uniref:GNAT family N-acetyltransferase n=1 Tax=Halobacillus mangrovi TaxID=402384 RepID=UPI003D986669